MTKIQENVTICKKLIKLIKPLRKVMYLAIFTGSVGHIMATIIPAIGAYMLAGIYAQEIGALKKYIIALVILAVVRSLLRYVEQMANHYVAFKTLHILRDKVFQAIRRLSPAKLDQKDKGSLISMTTADIELIEVFYAHTISPVAIAIIHTSVMLIILARYSLYYAVYLLVFHLIMAVLIPIITTNSAKDVGEKQRKDLSRLNNVILDTFMGIRECILYENGKERMDLVAEDTKKLEKSTKVLSDVLGSNQGMAGFVILISNIGILALGNILYQSGKVDFYGAIIPVVLYMSSFGPVSALSALAHNLLITFACGKRVLALLEEEPQVEEIVGKEDVAFEKLLVEEVDFSYEEQEVLKNMSCCVEKGKILGIFGKSGCGKSTLLKLIMRFYDVKQGQIQMNDKNIKTINTKNLRKNQAYVTQETYLFKDTIKNNIALANTKASMKEIEDACKKASIHDFIVSLKEGYETKVDSIKDSLSTGQMQRISLARAFLHDATLLLLDEPTSNIDAMNEAIILKALYKEKEEKGIIIVSHKESTLKIADEIQKVVRQQKS